MPEDNQEWRIDLWHCHDCGTLWTYDNSKGDYCVSCGSERIEWATFKKEQVKPKTDEDN